MEEDSSKPNRDTLFPKEIIEQTTQHHFWQHSVRSQVLYSSVLCSLVAALVALPFLYVDVSVSSQGIIRPVSERKMLVSPVSGRLDRLEIRENDMVTKGALVARVESPLLEQRLTYNRHRQQEVGYYIQDLIKLVNLDSTTVFNTRLDLKLAVHRRALIAFKQELKNMIIELRNRQTQYERKQYLYEKEAIAFAEVEESEFAFESARSRYQLLFDQRTSQWEAKLTEFQHELDKLRTEHLQLQEEQRQYSIHMPVTGTIQNMSGISEGSFIQINQQLAEISPDTGLVAECYVSPRDVGLLKEGMEVRFQIDAFDYNQWGTLTGTLTNISSDAIMNNDRPVFIVHSVPEQPYLELPNGYKGDLKKGMTLQARFTITKRSLFQLLYDNVDDWLNPTWKD